MNKALIILAVLFIVAGAYQWLPEAREIRVDDYATDQFGNYLANWGVYYYEIVDGDTVLVDQDTSDESGVYDIAIDHTGNYLIYSFPIWDDSTDTLLTRKEYMRTEALVAISGDTTVFRYALAESLFIGTFEGSITTAESAAVAAYAYEANAATHALTADSSATDFYIDGEASIDDTLTGLKAGDGSIIFKSIWGSSPPTDTLDNTWKYLHIDGVVYADTVIYRRLTSRTNSPGVNIEDGTITLGSATSEALWDSTGLHLAENDTITLGTAKISASATQIKLDKELLVRNPEADTSGYDVNFYGAYDRSRLFWDASKMALRAGREFTDGYWSDDSTGYYSVAMGWNVRATGDSGAIAMGRSTTANGEYGVTAMGYQTKAGGRFGATAIGCFAEANGADGATALGYTTFASGDNGATAIGYGAEASGSRGATAIGAMSIASGDSGSTALGFETVASGSRGATALGYGTTASGRYGSTALGWYTTAAGNSGATALGYRSNASRIYTIAIGKWVTADSSNTMILGSGVNNANRLINNIPYSLQVGFNDTTATLFVGGANKRVGVKTKAPAYELDVNGDIGADSVHAALDGNASTADSAAVSDEAWEAAHADTSDAAALAWFSWWASQCSTAWIASACTTAQYATTAGTCTTWTGESAGQVAYADSSGTANDADAADSSLIALWAHYASVCTTWTGSGAIEDTLTALREDVVALDASKADTSDRKLYMMPICFSQQSITSTQKHGSTGDPAYPVPDTAVVCGVTMSCYLSAGSAVWDMNINRSDNDSTICTLRAQSAGGAEFISTRADPTAFGCSPVFNYDLNLDPAIGFYVEWKEMTGSANLISGTVIVEIYLANP